jgi:hypothetical protein
MATRRRYGKKAGKSVERAMHKYKRGQLKGGKGGHPKAKSRKQAIAIGLSEARKKGAKVPRKKGGGRKSSKASGTSRKRATRKRSSSRKRSS